MAGRFVVDVCELCGRDYPEHCVCPSGDVVVCPNGDGSPFDCTPFCELCEGSGEIVAGG